MAPRSKSAMPSSPVRVYLIRHGETDHNVAGIIQGTLDTSLNKVGEWQAKYTGWVLARSGVVFEAVYTSDLQRAAKTAELITAQQAKPCPINPDARIRERDLGGLQGIRRPKVYDEVALRCEPYEKVVRRVLDFWDSLFPPSRSQASILPSSLLHPLSTPDKDTYPSVLVTSHGASLHALIEYGLIKRRSITITDPRWQDRATRPSRIRLNNCSITSVLMWDTGREGTKRWRGEFEVLSYDGHLYPDDSDEEEEKDVEVADDLADDLAEIKLSREETVGQEVNGTSTLGQSDCKTAVEGKSKS